MGNYFKFIILLFLLTKLNIRKSLAHINFMEDAKLVNIALDNLAKHKENDRRIYLESKNNQESIYKSSQGTLANINRASLKAIKESEQSIFYEYLTQQIQTDKNRIKRNSGLSSNISKLFFNEPFCSEEKQEGNCDSNHKYRTFSGQCNNLKNSEYGTRTKTFNRLMPSEYDDNISKPRSRSYNSQRPLPNPRFISKVIHKDTGRKKDRNHTLMLMQWGQFLDHDLSLTPMIRGFNNSILDCKECDSNFRHKACYPILIPSGDDYFPIRESRSRNRKCIPFTRSLPGQKRTGPREQINENTAFIDASHLYGSSPCRMRNLRSGKNGRLTELNHPKSNIFKSLMPTVPDNHECRSMMGICFHAGDDRSNEQPGLTSLHTLLLREHNRISDQLSNINTHWDDERAFQETRKIMIGINQRITYEEFLPRVLGPQLMEQFGLKLYNEGYYNGYDSTCNADILNEFATAAFRFGHTLISPMFDMMSETMKKLPSRVELKEHFNNPDVVYSVHFIDKLMRGLASKPMEVYDSSITKALTNHLFEEKGKPFSGMDLAALNIQRGRDHGLPGYIHYRNYCSKLLGKPENITTFQQLGEAIGHEQARKLAIVYRDIKDIDLFSGGISELSVSNGIIGQTFGCIIAEQFRRLKKCDRFWHETSDKNIGFSPEQLQEIRKVTLSSLICHNCDVPSTIQGNVMDILDEKSNPGVTCDSLQNFSILPWRDGQMNRMNREFKLPFCQFHGRLVFHGQKARISACKECYCDEGELNLNNKCQTINVDSCQTLKEEVGIDAIKADSNCQKQCPDLF